MRELSTVSPGYGWGRILTEKVGPQLPSLSDFRGVAQAALPINSNDSPGLDLAHGHRRRVRKAAAVAMWLLIESVLGSQRADLNRFERHIVERIAEGQASRAGAEVR